MRLMFGNHLLGQMVAILRQELDSMIRVIYLLSISDQIYRRQLIEASINGQQWTVKGKKTRITDKEMADLAGTLHGWTASIYKLAVPCIYLFVPVTTTVIVIRWQPYQMQNDSICFNTCVITTGPRRR